MAPIPVTWYKHSRRAILFEFPVQWTWDEFWEAKAASDAMMDAAEGDYALLLVAPANVKVPDNAISQGRAMISRRHPRSKLFVIVTPNGFVRSLVKVLAQVYVGQRGILHSALSLEAADALLAKHGWQADATESAT